MLAGALLAGCAQYTALTRPVAATPPATIPERFHLQGRLSVKTAEQAYSGGITWVHEPLRDEILVRSPLGQGLAELRRDPQGISLVDAEGNQYQAASEEALLEQTLGLRLPINGLVHWLTALPRPDVPYRLEHGEHGQVTRLEQDGWRLEYGRYREVEGRLMPGRLFARRDETWEFRLVVDQWNLP